MSTKGIVNIRGKEYKTVALRVTEFRLECPITSGWGIVTDMLECNEHHALFKATIISPAHDCVATGHAFEFWGDGNVNTSSALENAETSAIGRALSAAGWGGEEYCSADELVNALRQQGVSVGDAWVSEEEPIVHEPPVVQVQDIDDDAPDPELLRMQASALAGDLSARMDNYHEWHCNMLHNVCGVERVDGEMPSLDDVSNIDALVIFIDGQKEKLKGLGA